MSSPAALALVASCSGVALVAASMAADALYPNDSGMPTVEHLKVMADSPMRSFGLGAAVGLGGFLLADQIKGPALGIQ